MYCRCLAQSKFGKADWLESRHLFIESQNVLKLLLIPDFYWGQLAFSSTVKKGFFGHKFVYELKQSFANVLENWCSLKFWNIYRKTYVLESLFSKAVGLN